jgi:hypothetical protein
MEQPSATRVAPRRATNNPGQRANLDIIDYTPDAKILNWTEILGKTVDVTHALLAEGLPETSFVYYVASVWPNPDPTLAIPEPHHLVGPFHTMSHPSKYMCKFLHVELVNLCLMRIPDDDFELTDYTFVQVHPTTFEIIWVGQYRPYLVYYLIDSDSETIFILCEPESCSLK